MLYQIFSLLTTILHIYSILLIIYIFMSWLPGSRDTPFGQMLGKICEPYLEPFRKIIPPIGMLDISPLVAIIALNLAARGLGTLFTMLV